MNKSSNILLPIIKAGILNSRLSDAQKNVIDDAKILETYKLAKPHDFAHLICEVLKKENISLRNELLLKELKKAQSIAIYRYSMLSFEATQLSTTLEKHGIKHMLLKGAIVREHYPNPWMRTSCDIDVLMDESDAERAKEALIADCSYIFHEKTSHDIALYNANKHVHIELHYELIEKNRVAKIDDILENPWENASVKNGCEFTYEMSPEMFYFYHIAHMAKHFQDGGCGIKPIIDLWVIHNRMNYNEEASNVLLEKGGLFPFANAMCKLSRIWLDGEAYDDFSRELEKYIIDGGVYGSLENKVAVHQIKKGSKLRYALSKIFLKYEQLRFHYPVLNKHKWLFPFCQVRRWFKLLFRGGVRRSIHELELNKNMSSERSAKTAEMLTKLEL